ncbi:MAG: hypothetical protein KGM42_07820 [Hyphomicrobiales bacterium]|nr:hypothetical protein [Hyphomicrobiales bacterium]
MIAAAQITTAVTAMFASAADNVSRPTDRSFERVLDPAALCREYELPRVLARQMGGESCGFSL